jgi:hypothetical protein
VSTFLEVLIGLAAGGAFLWLFVVVCERLAMRRNVAQLVRYRAEQQIRALKHDAIRDLLVTANIADRRPGGGRARRHNVIDPGGDSRP